jgi:hypothetical protein
MTRTLTRSLRLMGATVAVAAAIAGFSATASAPASPATPMLAVATSFSPAGQ